MSFNGNEGEFITLREGSEMTKRYRNTIQSGDVIGQFFGSSIINEILNQNNCQGIRFYFGKSDSGKMSLVLVGVDANGNDLVDGKIADRGWDSPPNNSNSNALNS